ncbi:hypothetical protein CCACVL1_25593 [Corchorus capsularis]|uniref:Uncharacterized protein n=1 Tax=Corchorus capsularis TaxID=210143 RepID=A0A1R3GJ59_COCAP|nr:hypothetical protein CCACVL1_25593 [Corchorus capsularis]
MSRLSRTPSTCPAHVASSNAMKALVRVTLNNCGSSATARTVAQGTAATTAVISTGGVATARIGTAGATI